MNNPRKLLLLAACLLCAPVLAQVGDPTHEDNPVIVGSDGFLAAHPDLQFRQRGMKSQQAGRLADARRNFMRAARYADKPSQAMVAEMLWRGQGGAVDRPLAYAWMDLAAERGDRLLLAQRERYWAELSAAERERALAEGVGVYREYGDAVAKRRLEAVMLRAKRNITGSRVGHVGHLIVEISLPEGNIRVPADEYYADKYWQPEAYWRWQERQWQQAGEGKVDVGAPEQVGDGKP